MACGNRSLLRGNRLYILLNISHSMYNRVLITGLITRSKAAPGPGGHPAKGLEPTYTAGQPVNASMPVEQQMTTTPCPVWCENHAAGEPADVPCVGEIDFGGGYRLRLTRESGKWPQMTELSGPEGLTEGVGCIDLTAAPSALLAQMAELVAD
jgi:hypothetical protein